MSEEKKHHEVARLVRAIQEECRIILTALDELAEGQARHRFLVRCFNNCLRYQQELIPLVGEERTKVLIAQTMGEGGRDGD